MANELTELDLQNAMRIQARATITAALIQTGKIDARAVRLDNGLDLIGELKHAVDKLLENVVHT